MTVGQEFGSLLAGLPAYVSDPPIEAVCFVFGVSEDGQLGLDANGNVLAPKVLEALLGTRLRGRAFGRTPLVAGSRGSVAISADGDVYTWGWNSRATLGHGHRDPVPKPRRIAALRGVPIVQVALGGWHTLLLDNEGQVWACGGDEYMQCGQAAKERDVLVPTMCLPALRVCQVSAGGMHSLALTEDGTLWTWGEPWGSFSMTIDRRPHRVEVEDAEEIAERGGFVAIACGAFHNLALTATGEIYSFGLNDYGQLGLGHTASVTAPQRIVDGLEGVTVADISCGGWHSACVSTQGEVFMWGRGEYGRLGLGDKSGSSKLRPAKVWALEGVKMVQVSCGGSHTLGVTDDGKAWAWGRGSFGRLGTGEQRDAISPVEVKLPGGPERWHVVAVAAGGRHSLCFAVPDNGCLEERTSSGWEQRRQRSPMGLSPQSSGIRLNSAAIAAAAAAGAAAAAAGAATTAGGGGGTGRTGAETDGGADDELSTDPDGDSPISSGGARTQQDVLLLNQVQDLNIPPPTESLHQIQHRPVEHHQQAEEADNTAEGGIDGSELNESDEISAESGDNDGKQDEDDDDVFEENSLEELIAQAPSVVPNNNGGGSSNGSGGIGIGTSVESLISQGVASINLRDQIEQSPQQAPYLELSPSKQKTRYYRGTGGDKSGGAVQKSGSPAAKLDVKKAVATASASAAARKDQEEEEEDEEYGDVEPSEQESETEIGIMMGSPEVRRAASLAKATMHGLRDDLLGDRS